MTFYFLNMDTKKKKNGFLVNIFVFVKGVTKNLKLIFEVSLHFTVILFCEKQKFFILTSDLQQSLNIKKSRNYFLTFLIA